MNKLNLKRKENFMDKYINVYNEIVEEKADEIKWFLEQHASIAHMGEIVISSKDKPIIGLQR